MNSKILFLLSILLLTPLLVNNSFAQIKYGGFGDSPFERDFGDVKFLDAYFGKINEKLEVNPGDNNVPFTVVMANVGTQDITGIRGQLALPLGFSASDTPSSLALADADSNSLAGGNFHLTFFVNIDKNTPIQQFPASIKIDYSRLRESGIRTAFFDLNFKVTGKSVINVHAMNPFLTSLQHNHIIIEISNNGTAPISSVDIGLKNTQSEISSTTQSITNVENVVISQTNWEISQIVPSETQYIETDVYVPESLKGDTLRMPLDIAYFDAHGDKHTLSRIADFYIQGFIDTSIYNINVIDLSNKQMIVGEIINEGNEDALFGFVTVEPLWNSNIKKNTQFIDEIETDSPVPFNIPIEFDGDPHYGKQDVKITLRYKDNLRKEIFVTQEATIFINPPKVESKNDFQLIIIPIMVIVGVVVYIVLRHKKSTIQTN
jgi:hypothetical protein